MPAKPKPKLDWPADKVERWPITKLIPYARNARTHSDVQVTQIAGLIREFGWTTPVLVDEAGTLIAGHGRILAARELGLDSVPTIVVTEWSEAKRRAYRLADNRVALNSGWDTALLKVELADLQDAGADIEALGFSLVELEDLLSDGELLDLNQDAAQTGFNRMHLKWADKEIPLSEEETLALNAAYDAHYAEVGVAFGFIRRLLGRG